MKFLKIKVAYWPCPRSAQRGNQRLHSNGQFFGFRLYPEEYEVGATWSLKVNTT